MQNLYWEWIGQRVTVAPDLFDALIEDFFIYRVQIKVFGLNPVLETTSQKTRDAWHHILTTVHDVCYIAAQCSFKL